jgi:anti-anti-sigma factor
MPDQASATVLTLEVEQKGDTAVVRCHGRLVSGVTDVLYEQVSRLIPHSRRIILDLTDLKHMDSLGLGVLVRLYVSAKTSHCQLELINLGQQVRHLLGMTNLLDVFTMVGEHGIKMG